MDLLDWARGPLLIASAAVFLLGVSWRLYSLWRMPAAAAPSARARQAFGTGAAIGAAFSRFVPSGGFHPSATLVNVNPYVFHIGLAVIFLGYAPHIDFVRRNIGLGWPRSCRSPWR